LIVQVTKPGKTLFRAAMSSVQPTRTGKLRGRLVNLGHPESPLLSLTKR